MDIYPFLRHTFITYDKANPAERQEQKVADPINGKAGLPKVTTRKSYRWFGFFVFGKEENNLRPRLGWRLLQEVTHYVLQKYYFSSRPHHVVDLKRACFLIADIIEDTIAPEVMKPLLLAM